MTASTFARDAQRTPESIIAIVRRQLDGDCELGLFDPCPGDELDRIAARSVQSLWERSRVKTFLPVLALRHARAEIQARARASTTSNGLSQADPIGSVDALLEEIDALEGFRLTLTHDDDWEAVLVRRHERDRQRVIRIVASGPTIHDAVAALIARAHGMHWTQSTAEPPPQP